MFSHKEMSPSAGWIEAAIAWEVCASIHESYAKGKDPFYSTRHADFVRHAEDARAQIKEALSAESKDDGPLIFIGGQPHARFDEVIVMINDGVARASFCWCGKESFHFQDSFYLGQTLTLRGITGYSKIEVFKG